MGGSYQTAPEINITCAGVLKLLQKLNEVLLFISLVILTSCLSEHYRIDNHIWYQFVLELL
jgi:hypothetical protein